MMVDIEANNSDYLFTYEVKIETNNEELPTYHATIVDLKNIIVHSEAIIIDPNIESLIGDIPIIVNNAIVIQSINSTNILSRIAAFWILIMLIFAISYFYPPDDES